MKTTARLSGNYVTKTAAEAAGYKPDKASNNYVPGVQIGGDICGGSTKLLPSAPRARLL
ncbi:hypothetical protein NLX85_26130 [Micromonospora sp. A3M-1-15]|uniref:hypothetical protein n=1 Tax=Micromonospora sp. A3M-1-15 TaxID=2962035 RepID=UPI0020B8FD86|nr:hypothetical protein [Micromonospora sp. A3M-1-15]MCP3786850.1 hypothetical protein [Micromonospora sp. A3M-1-15]